MELLHTLIEWLTQLVIAVISSTGEWGVFVLSAAESANIPIPSEIILPFGGFLASARVLSFWLVVFAGAAGNLIGSLISYVVGAWGGRPFLDRYGKYVLISPKDLDRGDRAFKRYGSAIAFWSRLLPVVRTFISLPAGINRAPLKSFAAYTFAGSFIWSWLLAYIGFILGENWAAVRPYFEQFSWAIVGFIILGGVLYIWKHVKDIGANNTSKEELDKILD